MYYRCCCYFYLRHALVPEREAPGLADDKVIPLDNDDGREEGGVAGLFYRLPLVITLQQ
jgi:hypothetical protein